MKILLDENVDNRLKEVLENEDFTVSTTFEQELTGEKDRDIMLYSSENGFAILTHDDDFLSLMEEIGQESCIIYMPQKIAFREMKERTRNLKDSMLEKGEIIFL